MKNLPKEITENGIHYTLHSAEREKSFFVKPILERRILCGGADRCDLRPARHFHVFEKPSS